MNAVTSRASTAPGISDRRRAESSPSLLAVIGPLLWPCVLLLVGAAIGFPFALEPDGARERLVGITLDTLLGVVVLLGLRRAPDQLLPRALICCGAVSLLGCIWIAAAAGADTFRGPVGHILQLLLQPVFGRVVISDSIGIGNTRFIIGYNGVADLCLVALWATSAALWMRPSAAARLIASVLLAIAAVVLVGSGSRGGLLGLLAGLTAVGIFGWRRGWLLAPVAALAVGVLAWLGVLDKGFDLTSTTGRLTFWSVYARLLLEYPLTGVGLGLETAYRVVNFYEANPYPDGIYYAHNTFVQTYLEAGPVGTMGMLALPLAAFLGAVAARRDTLSRARHGLLLGGVGLVAALEGHGLTDQVVTTNVGTALVILAVGSIVASLGPAGLRWLSTWLTRAGLAVAALCLLALLVIVGLPSGRAQLLLNVGNLQLDQAILHDANVDRQRLAIAESTFKLAQSQDPLQPAVLRQLAWTHLKGYDTDAALESVKAAASSPRIDPFDRLQIAHIYRELGFSDEAYTWATEAFATWGRAPAEPILLPYEQATLADNPRAQSLANRGEAALRARAYSAASTLFRQALRLQPTSTYLQDRLNGAERGIEKYGPGSASPDDF